MWIEYTGARVFVVVTKSQAISICTNEFNFKLPAMGIKLSAYVSMSRCMHVLNGWTDKNQYVVMQYALTIFQAKTKSAQFPAHIRQFGINAFVEQHT